MRMKTDYKPKYSLSIKYLSMIMTKSELKNLIKKYVEKKIQYGGKYTKVTKGKKEE